jgi:hypothetical protein
VLKSARNFSKKLIEAESVSIMTGSHEMFTGRGAYVNAPVESPDEKGAIAFSKLELL